MKQDALDNLPAPFFDAGRNLYQFFIPKGLDAKDQVVLLGKNSRTCLDCIGTAGSFDLAWFL